MQPSEEPQNKEILGVMGSFLPVYFRHYENGLRSKQVWESEPRKLDNHKRTVKNNWIKVKIRFDDQCQNGHMTFAITGTTSNGQGGCIHDLITEKFPELRPLIKWHLFSTDGGMHAIPNAIYHASNRDYNGLRKGEKRQIQSPSGDLWWDLVVVDDEGEKPAYTMDTNKCTSGDRPSEVPVLKWIPSFTVGEGKERNLEAARAKFPTSELSDELLTSDEDTLRKHLETVALPQSITDFRAAMQEIGMEWVELSK